ncbi:hypothetical protein [Paenibacillus eucommiae]|uniref:DUF4367 domain-containing protein n=1 Tax=Paenibacillus eucommiae TaxID=1355755 RepID=A0ABS4J4V8_9BACL|nr:hypothetical protein [Paenibacillus eucommiae]MBP1994863.1 hypothetical protein [Paenibacillus eucommiae]
MGREQSNGQFEGLKQHSAPDHQLSEIDITERVMTRIAAKQAGGRLRSRGPARRFSLSVTALLIVLLVSASAYAASEFIQIRNHARDVKIQSVVLDSETRYIPYKKEDGTSKPTYRDRVLALVKPGEVLAYYVRDGRSNPYIQYLDDTRISSSYNDFKELLVRTSAPVIKEPSLPAGFKFQYGSVMPLLPYEHDERTSAEYARLLTLFQQRALAEPDQDLFVEEVNWSEAEISALEYEDDLMNLRIQAMKNIIGMEVSYTSEFTQKTLDIGGIETIFASGIIHGYKKYEAIWYDEAQNTHYKITASGNVHLTEDQFKQIVENMVKG